MDRLIKEPPWKDEGSEKKLRDCDPGVPVKSAQIIISELTYFNNGLISKDCVDRVDTISDKPPVEAGGRSEFRETTPKATNDVDSHIVAHGRISRKQEIPMIERGFIPIPRSLITSDSWRNLNHRQQKVFLYFLERAQYIPKIFTHDGFQIPVAAGQFCTTFRRLVKEYNQTLKFKEEEIDLPFLQRCVSKFARNSWAIHETIHGITRITISISSLCEHFKKLNDTHFDTKSIQDRYTNEERKKERRFKEETIEGVDSIASPFFDIEMKEEEGLKENDKDGHSNEKEINFIWDFIVNNKMDFGNTANKKPGIKKKDVTNWLKKDSCDDVMECLKKALKATISKTYPGYVNKLLKEKIPQKESDSASGRKYVESLVSQHKMDHIEFTKDYFRDDFLGSEMYYYLPRETLYDFLKKSFEMAQERKNE